MTLKDPFSRFTQYYRNRLSTALGHAFIRAEPDDAYIAAFPRSGSTWLRTMLTHIRLPEADMTAQRYNDHIPAVSIRNAQRINANSAPRLIMTHSRYRKSIKKAVYLVRDGRDAMVSYYYYSSRRQRALQTFEGFLGDHYAGQFGLPWHEHVLSWLGDGRAALSDNLLVLQYEEMLEHPHDSLSRVCAFLGMKHDNRRLEQAIAKSSLANMRLIERLEAGRTTSQQQSFYRAGHANQWQQMFVPAERERFEAISALALQMAGYNA